MSVLFVVATPLGNLEDLSPRAEKTLREVDLIACEDTRRTGKLLNHLGIVTPMLSYHEHNEEARSDELLEKIRSGVRVALVSDAGTPLLSDPGYRVVRKCRLEGLPVIPIPGPSAAVAALSVAGLPSDRFFFAGFPPRRSGMRKAELAGLADLSATLVFYLSPHALAETLASLLEALGDREAFLIREMTKLHETPLFGRLSLLQQAVGQSEARGEYTLVVAGAEPSEESASLPIDVKAYVEGLMLSRNISRGEAVKQAARELQLSRNQVYSQALGEPPSPER